MHWMKRKQKQVAEIDPVTLCAWRHRQLGDDEPCLACGAKLRPEARHLLKGQEGHVVSWELLTTGGKIYATVPMSDSPATTEGFDCMFQTCSKTCADALDAQLKEEFKISGQLGEPPAGG